MKRSQIKQHPNDQQEDPSSRDKLIASFLRLSPAKQKIAGVKIQEIIQRHLNAAGQPTIEEVLDVFCNPDQDSDLYKQMWQHYGDILHKAVNHGRMATPERMIALYPILREIADEVDTLI